MSLAIARALALRIVEQTRDQAELSTRAEVSVGSDSYSRCEAYTRREDVVPETYFLLPSHRSMAATSQHDQRCVLGRAQQPLVLAVGAELLARDLRDEIVSRRVDDGALVGREGATARGLVFADERRRLLARRRERRRELPLRGEF